MTREEDVFQKLLALAKSKKTEKSLIAIQNLCLKLREQKHDDFSISTISRLGKASGIPSAQSIRNKSGELYRILIKAWKDGVKNKAKTQTINDTDWIHEIEDPIHKFLILDLLRENSDLKSELKICKSIKELQIDLRESHVDHQSIELTNLEKQALSLSINSEVLSSRGWRKTSRGAIEDSNGRTILKNGFVTAVNKVISV